MGLERFVRSHSNFGVKRIDVTWYEKANLHLSKVFDNRSYSPHERKDCD